jgi:hypothetical protein
MNLSAIWSVIKIVGIAVVVGIVVWFIQDYRFQLAEAARLSENQHQTHIADSTGMSKLTLRNGELEEYLKYQDPALLKKLDQSNIRLSRIESIVSTTLQYRDTVGRRYDFTGVANAIRKNIPGSQPFVDSTGCMIIRGKLRYENDSLKFEISDRQFKNKSDGVAFWQRREWKFLGIKTRFLGKKEFTAKVFDECGQSKTLRIEKQK